VGRANLECAGDDFRPPYVLGGRLAVVAGVLRNPPLLPAAATSRGWRPVELCGGTFTIVVASRYDHPPPQQPIRYDEVVVGMLLRRGLRLAALPLSMQVSERLPVVEGREHYSLPKTYEPGLDLSIGEGEPLRLIGEELRLEGTPPSAWKRGVLWLPCLSFALGVWALTAVVPDLGLAGEPHRWVIVSMTPAGAGCPVAVREAELPAGAFRALWGQTFASCRTWLGPPHRLEPLERPPHPKDKEPP
jgi:hypothetical protein